MHRQTKAVRVVSIFTWAYVRGLIASGNTPSVLLTHVTTVGPEKCSVTGWDLTMSIRSVALPFVNDT